MHAPAQEHPGDGSASSEGDSVRGSACDAPARLRLTSLRPSSCGCCAGDRGPLGDAGEFREAACGARGNTPRSGVCCSEWNRQ